VTATMQPASLKRFAGHMIQALKKRPAADVRRTLFEWFSVAELCRARKAATDAVTAGK